MRARGGREEGRTRAAAMAAPTVPDDMAKAVEVLRPKLGLWRVCLLVSSSTSRHAGRKTHPEMTRSNELGAKRLCSAIDAQVAASAQVVSLDLDQSKSGTRRTRRPMKQDPLHLALLPLARQVPQFTTRPVLAVPRHIQVLPRALLGNEVRLADPRPLRIGDDDSHIVPCVDQGARKGVDEGRVARDAGGRAVVVGEEDAEALRGRRGHGEMPDLEGQSGGRSDG